MPLNISSVMWQHLKNVIGHHLTINLDQNVDFLFPSRVLRHQRVLARIVAVYFVNNECGGCVCDLNESSVVQVNTGFAPGEDGNRTATDFDKHAQRAAGTQADGLLQVIVELEVWGFCWSAGQSRMISDDGHPVGVDSSTFDQTMMWPFMQQVMLNVSHLLIGDIFVLILD